MSGLDRATPIATSATTIGRPMIIFLCLARTIAKSRRLTSFSGSEARPPPPPASVVWLLVMPSLILKFSPVRSEVAQNLEAGYPQGKLIQNLRPVLELLGPAKFIEVLGNDDG